MSRSNGKPMKVLSLYCGCGGMDWGFETNKSFEVRAAFDMMPYAVECYNMNFANKAQVMDVSRLLHEDFDLGFQPDVILGGPPCQDFSRAGNRTLGERANQTFVYCDIVCKHLPKFFVMENVQCIESTGRTIFEEVKRRFKEHGYGLTISKVKMWEYGVPQKRIRLIVVGRLGGKDDELKQNIDDAKSPISSMREYLDKNPQPHLELNGKDFVYFHPRSFSSQSVFSLDSLAPTQRTVLGPLRKQHTFSVRDATHERELIHPVSHYRLASAVQAFPCDWKFPTNHISKNAKIIGNAVPPLFSTKIAKILSTFIPN